MARPEKRPADSAISERQKQLIAEAARNKAEEARLQRMVDAAPKKREELVKKQRDEFLNRKGRVVQLEGTVDHRLDALTARPARDPRVRKDRTFSQLLFVLLVVAFCLSLYYAFRVIGGG